MTEHVICCWLAI